MKGNCIGCKHSVNLGIITDDKSLFGCKEVFYFKTKYDSSKRLKLTSFIPVVSEDDSCLKFEERQ